ncbi:hypothetical protein [Bradyrhizobium sp. B117]|uniref:hypothetical protein n=1 Tax=Bradyrhizobium sp. B117 TaxID=3140246 RepID=UPI0031830276
MMRDLVMSVTFVFCQLCFLGLLVSPLLLSDMRGIARRSAWWGILPAVLATILVITAAVDIFKAEYQVDYAKTNPLEAEVLAGKQVVIKLYPETCVVFNLGSIACGTNYHGRYEREKNSWTFSGPDSKTGALVTATTVGEPIPGRLSLWGMLSRFEADGTIFYLGQGIGHLHLAKGA